MFALVGGGGPLWAHERYRLHRAAVAAELSRRRVDALDRFMKDLCRADSFAPAEKQRLLHKLAEARGQRWVVVTPLAQFLAAPPDVAFELGHFLQVGASDAALIWRGAGRASPLQPRGHNSRSAGISHRAPLFPPANPLVVSSATMMCTYDFQEETQ